LYGGPDLTHPQEVEPWQYCRGAIGSRPPVQTVLSAGYVTVPQPGHLSPGDIVDADLNPVRRGKPELQ